MPINSTRHTFSRSCLGKLNEINQREGCLKINDLYYVKCDGNIHVAACNTKLHLTEKEKEREMKRKRGA